MPAPWPVYDWRMTFRIPTLIAVLTLSACAAPQPEPAEPAPVSPDQQFTDCFKAGDIATLAGLPASQAALRHDRAVRVIPNGSVVTQDYDPTRLNLVTDPDGVVLRAYCG